MDNAINLIADKVIILPSLDEREEGFTCTGVYYDEKNRKFYVGNAGKQKMSDEHFEASIVVLSEDFEKIEDTIECFEKYPNMRDIQGVTIDNDGNVWLCSCGENLVRCIDLKGNSICNFSVKNPSGITFDSLTSNLWVLTDKYMIEYSTSGEELKKYYCKIDGQDQLYFSARQNRIYFTAGSDYNGASYVYSFDIQSEEFALEYILPDSNAIEGIFIIDNDMYILNDGLYHEAKSPHNQVNIYKLKN